MEKLRVLLLGGTTEASGLAARLAEDDRFAATLSLAGVTRHPALPAIAHRIGGFGGAEGLRAWLVAEAVDALVDATHPFAARISQNAVVAAAAAGVKLLRIERPPWQAEPGDRWTLVPDAETAASALGITPRQVLLTVGSKSLAAFRAAPQHHYVIRCIDAPDPALLPPRAELLLARGPFSLDAENTLLAEKRTHVLVTKNSGGEATAAKLVAARRAGVEVVMIDRPAACVAEPVDAMRWLLALRQARQPSARGA